MSKWFKHEDDLLPGEKDSEPILGKRFGLFWFFGMFILLSFTLMFLYMVFQFVMSGAHGK